LVSSRELFFIIWYLQYKYTPYTTLNSSPPINYNYPTDSLTDDSYVLNYTQTLDYQIDIFRNSISKIRV